MTGGSQNSATLGLGTDVGSPLEINCYKKGADLRAARRQAGLTQAELAKRIRVSRDAVQYWEAKDSFIPRYGTGRQICDALGIAVFPHQYAHARGWGVTLSDKVHARLDAQIASLFSRMQENQAQRLARIRVICGAKTRMGGTCRNKSEPGKRRCKFHGGKSTGAKTPEGIARIADAQGRRWAHGRSVPPDTE